MPNTNNPNPEIQWFTEAVLPFTSETVRTSIAYTKKLHDNEGPFGHVEVYDTPFHGRMLTLDGIVQVAENDEFIYHEMMVTLPAVKHGNPKSVLIIGGGDGGAVKQALRIKSVERVVLVEIDKTVIDVCERYIPSIADGSLQNDKVEVIIEDGMKYVRDTDEKFDIVALDLTDPLPDGPAAELYDEPFYQDVKAILTENGVMSSHCSSLVMQPDEARVMIPRLKKVFGEVALHTAVVPTYQMTSFGFLISRAEPVPLSNTQLEAGFANISGDSKYLTLGTLAASQVLPPYLAGKIGLSS